MEKQMKMTVSIVVLMAAFAAPSFACDKPTAPASFPDGKTAAMDQMMAAKKAIDAYKKGVEDYLTCEKNDRKADDAAKELSKVADRFNAEVKAFKAKG
jgi:hypothetical protein